jgi:hypothetical protein
VLGLEMSYLVGKAKYKVGRELLRRGNYEGQAAKLTTAVEVHFSTERSKETGPHCSDAKQQQ